MNYLDGPHLVRTECDTYDAGSVIVVCWIIEYAKEKIWIIDFVDFHLMFTINI